MCSDTSDPQDEIRDVWEDIWKTKWLHPPPSKGRACDSSRVTFEVSITKAVNVSCSESHQWLILKNMSTVWNNHCLVLKRGKTIPVNLWGLCLQVMDERSLLLAGEGYLWCDCLKKKNHHFSPLSLSLSLPLSLKIPWVWKTAIAGFYVLPILHVLLWLWV